MSFLKKTAGLVLLALLVQGIFCEAAAGFYPKKRRKAAFNQGQSDVQLGIGFPSLIKPETDTLQIFGAVERKIFPPIQARYEYGVTDNIGIGALMGVAFSTVTITDNTDPDNVNGFKYTYYIAGARFAWHQPVKVDKLDFYGVAFAGASFTSVAPFGPSNPLDPYKKTFAWSVHAGASYYFLGTFGAFLEVGYGVAIANGGLTLKF
ncbi:MAG: hypothetical protein FD123_2974 [Bacteroidetes bacterium]|nr:MAG: hypothetical protein FD123_2974 [Bacteroidota bacterium]